jgi:FKBP-type peptidyl-prolyl cis-trans isomerase SlyD
MIISEGRTVAITYTLTLDNGDTIDSNVDDEPLTYTHGTETLIAGLEKALEGLRRGDSASVHIQPEEGYGPVIEDALIEVPLDRLPPEGRTVGAQITAVSPEEHELTGVVTALTETTATVDFNHPLAGEALHFQVTIVDVQ